MAACRRRERRHRAAGRPARRRRVGDEDRRTGPDATSRGTNRVDDGKSHERGSVRAHAPRFSTLRDASRRQAHLHHRRRRLHRDDARPRARRREPGRRGRQPAPRRAHRTELGEHPNFEFHQVDVLDAAALAELAKGATHIVHCAAIAGVDTVIENPVLTMRVNMVGTYNALEAALAHARHDRALHRLLDERGLRHARLPRHRGRVSTIGSVGEARWTYAVSKLAGEHMARAYHDELGLPAMTVHPFNVFGPGPDRRRRDPRVHRGRARRRRPEIHGDGSQIRAWCYVDRHGRRRARVPRAPGGGRARVQHRQPALGGDDLRPRAARSTGSPARTGEIVLRAARLGRRRAADPQRRQGAELLGWEPQVELDDGLARTIAWYREQKQPASV